jgi:radical SAM protein with 4Fe4S-binding SPASM domain
MTWVLDLDRGQGSGLELLDTYRDASHRLVIMARVGPGLDLAALVESHPGFPVVLGSRPRSGDALWLKRLDHDHFQANAEARILLESAAEQLGLSVDSGDERRPRQCSAPLRTPVISWDGKVSLCPWDLQMENRVGDIGDESFSQIWKGPAIQEARTQCATRGVPDRSLCMDCPMPWSPNHGS